MILQDFLPSYLLQQNISLSKEILQQNISSVTLDSRDVKDGSLFAALPGEKVNGCTFIEKAFENGAVAFLVPNDYQTDNNQIEKRLIKSENPRRDLAEISALYYRQRPAFISAVTGTNGKTSTAWFCYEIWKLLGKKGASLGTIGLQADDLKIDGALTTPDPVMFHEILAKAARHHIDYLCYEASSHGLDQYRTDGAIVNAAVFTNLSEDHLDYHHDMETYFKAKQKLFTRLLDISGTAIINADDIYGERLIEDCLQRGVNLLRFGKKGVEIKLLSVKNKKKKQAIQAEIMGHRVLFDLFLFGEFQIYNIFAAIGVCLASGTTVDDIIKVLPLVKTVPGRMESIPSTNGALILVDYAHMGEALKMALITARPVTDGKLVVLFGCGGQRPFRRRSEMGKIAQDYADVVYITDDNPRSEDPAHIRKDILDACPKGIEIAGRYEAIKTAIENLEPEDTLIIAGKGHEQGQIIGDKISPFDDRDVVREICKTLKLNV